MISGLINGILWVGIILIIAFAGWALNRRSSPIPSAADRPDLRYSVFTDEFDLVTNGRDLHRVLEADGELGKNPRNAETTILDDRRRLEQASFESTVAVSARTNRELGDAAVCLLVDMSGSMVNQMPALAGQLRALHKTLGESGAHCAIYGFTTRGWRGGLARSAWMDAGRPDYPGRLCVLQHVVLAEFSEPLDCADWDGLLHADALRENIDGEALRWAADRLRMRHQQRKVLLVISDGAPVDDSTITANGSGFLMRDLRGAISEVSASEIELLGLGVSYRVDELYPRSASITKPTELADAAIELIDSSQKPKP